MCAARVQARISAITLPRDGNPSPRRTVSPLPASIVRLFNELSYSGVRHIALRIGKQPHIVKGDMKKPVVLMTSTSEEIRLRYLYRHLIIQGKIKISLQSALGLVGPDCAFHLYSVSYPCTKRQRRKKP